MKKELFALLAALLCATTTWAQTTVTTDQELRAAVQINKVNILLANDIDLSNSTLSIESGKTVTIDLGGFTLDRKLTKRGEGGGQVITVREGATLTQSNGTLKGGWGGAGGALVNEGGMVTLTDVIITNNVADDRGGGICNRKGGTLVMNGGVITDNSSNDHSGAKGGGGLFNEENATATLTGVTITGNTAKLTGGGGICNFGTLTLDGCTITGNKAGTYGGAIWQEGTLNMQGKNTITDNTTAGSVTNNLFLKTDTVVIVTGALTGSKIGITMEGITGVFTSGYSVYNNGVEPSDIFSADNELYMVALFGDEANYIGKLTTVTTEDELRTAVELNGANITLANDITVSCHVTIWHNATIDLDGHTLRGNNEPITHSGDFKCLLIVAPKGKLTLSNGTLTGSDNSSAANLEHSAGAIVNKGTTTLTGVTITNCKGREGGAIRNVGTLTLDGCTVTGNTAATEGGGVWNSATATLNVQGENAIMANMANGDMTNNVFLETNVLVTVTGELAGSQIGISMKTPGVFTSGFSAKSGVADPTHIFSADMPGDIMAVSSEGGEGSLSSVLPSGTVYYVTRDWDSKKSKVTSTINYLTEQIDFDATPTKKTQYKLLTSSSAAQIKLGTKSCDYSEFYVVKGKVTVNELFIVGPYVHFVLCDGAELVLGNNITVRKGHALCIHDQGSYGRMGKLYSSDKANIGGKENSDTKAFEGGEIYIYGGDINVKGHDYEAAIGGDYQDMTGDITIYGGNIRAEGGAGAAGIGSGNGDDDYGTIHIFGGTIDAIGGRNLDFFAGGAGIGGGMDGKFGRLYVYGGYITATTQSESAGIGSSQMADFSNGAGHMFIYGGTIRAYGGTHAAGIGGGDGISGGEIYIYGGHVEAYGGTDAAGIGGGEGGNGARSGIYGGYVYAKGGWEYGAGIGGGQGGGAEKLEIHGGIVIAEAGMDETGCRAIGPGGDCDDYGTLWLDPRLMVTSERTFTAGERNNGCRYRTRVRVEPCNHKDHTYTWSGTTANDTHLQTCQYCDSSFKEEKHKFVDKVCTVCGVHQTMSQDDSGIADVPEASASGTSAWYSLDGRKLQGKPTKKGVYINNGKSVVIK